MELTLVRNDFCEFPWPARLSWNFEAVQYGDSKSLILSAKGKTLHGIIQVWDLNGNDLKTFHSIQWSRLTSAPKGFPPGIKVEQIETDGTFREWVGVSIMKHPEPFVDYELMSKNNDTIIYVRRSSNKSDPLDIRRELSMIKVDAPDSWAVDAPLERTAATNSG